MEKEACAWTHMPHGIEQWMQKKSCITLYIPMQNYDNECA
jgi:hypothetical protein